MQAFMEIDDDDDDVMEISIVPMNDEDNDDLLIDSPRSRSLIKVHHQHIITHVVWPRQLPSKENVISEHETTLIALMADTLDWFENMNVSFASSSKLFRGMFNTNTSPSPEIIMSEINRLKHGDMFGYFVKQQNIGISIFISPATDSSSVQPKSAIVSTYPVSIPKEEIYSVEHSEFQVEFPAQSVNVDFSAMMNSEEFSQQLSYLNSNAVSGTEPEFNAFVSQWLVPMLSTHHSTVIRQTDFPIISKKIRDDVFGGQKQQFRRSPYWTFLKAILQLILTVELGDVTGKIVYKLVMLKCMAVLCNYYNWKMYSKLNVDVVQHMLAKLARRIEKIDDLISSQDEQCPNKDVLPDGFEDIFNNVTDEVKLVISKVKQKLVRQIEAVQNEVQAFSTLIPLSQLDFIADVRQKLPKLKKYLSKRQIQPQANENNEKLKVKLFSRHSIDSTEAPDVNVFDRLKNPVDIAVYLCDFENWILYALNDFEACTCETLRSFSFAYGQLATKYYKDDPLGFSRIVLTQIKILILLDKRATQAHDLLKKHRPGVNPDVLNSLILPHYEDLEAAHEMKKYFVKRCLTATHPSLLEEEKVTVNSFSAQYAEQNDTMQAIIKEIQESADVAKAKLKKEWLLRRREVSELRNQSGCQYNHIVNSNGKRQRASCLCEYSTQISSARVAVFEEPLPEADYEKNAVVFELRIPIEIACLRDVLYEVVKMLNEPTKRIQIFEKWASSDALDVFDQSASERVFLGTNVKGNTGHTGHTSGRTSGRKRIAGGVHPDEPFESCIVPNNRTCTFYGSHDDGVMLHIPTIVDKQSVTKFVSLNVEKGSPYESLQWTITGKHTQNEVIARQCECHQSLSLSEFKNFGSLRADGHRLQLRKLYAMIETESLCFETLSVQALIMQTVWEVGPSRPLASQWNEAHQDLSDPKFAGSMIDLIGKFINTQKCNWKHPLKLLMTVVIAVRVFELNDDVNLTDRIVQLLVTLREIAYDWMAKVQIAMHETETQADVEKLRMNLVEIAIAGTLTFFVHFRHQYFDKIFVGSVANGITAVRFWMEFVCTVNANIFFSKKKEILESSAIYLKMFQRLIYRIAVHIQPKLREAIVNDPSDVFEFIKSQWHRSRDGHFQLKLNERHSQTIIVSIMIEDVEHFVQIGIITGEFLVNNLSVSRLPKSITNHPVFKRVFDEHIFEVHQGASGRFDTKHKYKDSYYSFYGSGNDEVIIVERKQNADEYELIPENIFFGEIPYLLIKNHSHWWNKTKKIIEFRPLRFNDPIWWPEEGVQYELDLVGKTLLQTKTKKVMLDVTSETFQKIYLQLSRLESKKYIHIFMESPQIAKVELVRMNIKFLVDASDDRESYDVISNEFNGMRVCSEQNCGTLYGLRQGLLLESIPDGNSKQKKLMILPHGNVNARINGCHEIVEINVEDELRTPSFFVYHMDEVCQQLRANNRSYAAWFYLAYLHALTSHGLPEPFTEMTGTERSLQILQSAFVWSTAPYDDEAIVTLKLIQKLAPVRRIRNNFQSARWPDMVEVHAAQDGFHFIVNQLIADSVRLDGLYPNIQTSSESQKKSLPKKKLKVKNDEQDFEDVADVANMREYFRNLPFFPNLRLSNDFIKHDPYSSAHYIPNTNNKVQQNVRQIANLYHKKTFISPDPDMFELTHYLTSDVDYLKGPADLTNTDEILQLFSTKRVRDEWLSLYNVARSGQFSREKLALVLGLLAYGNHKEDDLNSILILQTVAENQQIFNRLDPPNVRTYDLNERHFDDSSIIWILEQSKRDFTGYRSDENQGNRYDHILKLVKEIRAMWPCEQVNPSIYRFTHPGIDLRIAVEQINKKLRDWRNFERLIEFLQEIDVRIGRLNATSINNNDEILQWCPEKMPFKGFRKFYVNFDAKIIEILPLFEKEVSQAEKVCIQSASVTKIDWWFVYKSIATSCSVQHLIDAGMYPRVVLSLVLPQLLSATQNPKLKAIICAVGVQIVNEQREQRISIYSQQPELKAALDQETKSKPHENWLPWEYPEWLLFEIEQDLTIRPIQIEIAKRMIDPPDIGTKHSVMQLNMGEGKTAVIVPILAAILANGQQLCQVTVLKPLFATNLKELRQCLGGMLNRRLYTFPCRRDMPINKYVEKIFEIYVECTHLKGVVLTLPEYRLSFQLKIYEAPSKEEKETGKQLLRIHNWLMQNARNIMDESDAILQPKYQLIYTLGQQLSLDGGTQRWTVIQSLLKRLPYHLKKLWEYFGDEKIEFDRNYVRNRMDGNISSIFRQDIYTPCRILDNNVYEQLKLKIIDDCLSGKLNIALGVNYSDKLLLKLLLSDEDLSTEAYDKLMSDLTLIQRNTVLILCGFLRFNVLQLVLSKRWRVNYGVNDSGQRKMAIPFKAKDVPAEMTEFGHPDVAICLTQLSYYYSGLSDTQLYEVFKLLQSQQNSLEIYEAWIRSVPSNLVDETIQSYTGVNLSDPKQRDELVFPLFRYNMLVIDYWLSNLVYPREAKTFEHKLMCTAWDLVSDSFKHTVSGFSGTNDTKNILPLPIMQNDLKKLEQTNDNVRNILLRSENSGYYPLPANVRGLQILIELSKMKIPVLLDAGACMLELNNEQVAKQWLNFVDATIFDASVYFNSNDVMMTVDRNGIITEYDYSVYRNKLDRCLVYLDDTHTRGTDLKFPMGWKACVTLSGDITRDKTVQACMRMRLLGKGHSIVFMASYEADVRIREYCNLGKAKPNSKNVLDFICNNSRRFEEENTVHWSAAAYNYCKKLVAHKLHENSQEADASDLLHLKCKDTEFVTLKDMYGQKEASLLINISKNQFDKIIYATFNNREIMRMVTSVYHGVCAKLTKHAPRIQRYTQSLDEEQEKELEQELEEQRQVERPSPAVAAIPVFDKLLKNIVRSGISSQSFKNLQEQKGIMSLDESLLNKPLYNLHKHDPSPWSKNLYVTRDFVTVVKNRDSEEYLRPVWWIAHVMHHEDDNDIFLLLSSYETDRLLPLFRKSTRSTLMSYRPRLSQLHSNLLHDVSLHVTGTTTNSNDRIGLNDEVQIAMYSGSMYFENEMEQNSYCGFMGLIPSPRTPDLELAFENGYIERNSFVLIENRRYSDAIAEYLEKCKFVNNPVELAMKLIEGHHVFIRRESHVAAILEKGTKKKFD